MKILRYVFHKLAMVVVACAFAASTPIRAQEAKSDSASAGSGDNARLIVNRAANFGILESVTVFVESALIEDKLL
jgi:hypothetical protein